MVRYELDKVSKRGVPTVIFVVTTPFAVNAFLSNHIVVLSKKFRIILCTNLDAYKIDPGLLNSVEMYHVPFSRRVSLGLDIKSLLKLIMLVWKIRPAAIHSITPKAGLIGMLAGFVACVPNRWHTFTGQVWVIKKGFVRVSLKAFDRIISRLASRVFVDSASQRWLLHNENIAQYNQIGMLGSGSIAGVDLNRFCVDTPNRMRLRQQMLVNSNTCVFLFVGRLAKDKGVFDLIRAFLELSITVRDIQLWVVGPDEEGLMQALQESAEGCDAIIKWMGATLKPEEFMAASDVLLLPSYREGFGSVIIEAAACGIPTIAYRIDGVIDAVIDGSTGILVERGQISAFVSAMRRLALDRDLRVCLGHEALGRAVRDFNSKSITNAWLDFYCGQLNNNHEATD